MQPSTQVPCGPNISLVWKIGLVALVVSAKRQSNNHVPCNTDVPTYMQTHLSLLSHHSDHNRPDKRTLRQVKWALGWCLNKLSCRRSDGIYVGTLETANTSLGEKSATLPHIAVTMATATPELRLPLKSQRLRWVEEERGTAHYSQEMTKKRIYFRRRK